MDCGSHDTFDCEFFANGAGKLIGKDLLIKNFGIFALLKLLLLLENPETRENCQALVEKPIKLDEYRGEDSTWQEHEEHVVQPIMVSGLLDALGPTQHLTLEMLHEHCIRIDNHAFEMTARDGDTLKGVFVCGASLPHNCVPNTVVALDDEFNMKLYAAVPLKSGDIVYNSYTNPLMGTSQRQHQLHMTRRLQCECSRCRDPTEFGTHMSSMKCKQCPNGYAVCDMVRNSGGDWQCTCCEAIITASEVHTLLADVGGAMVEAQGDIRAYETLLGQYKDYLHPNHFLLLDIKQNIASILRAAVLMNSMLEPCKMMLERRAELCADLLAPARAVVPGISKLYAIALFEAMLASVELSELQFAESDLTKREYADKLKKARTMAAEALELLKFEPPNSQEGYLTDRINMEIERIDSDVMKYGCR